MLKNTIPVAVAYGDGIGPEIMKAVLTILHAAKLPIEFQEVTIGESVYLGGCKTGIEKDAWEIIKKAKVFLKSPVTTPQGGGYKSVNVTIRATLGLFANVRPCIAYAPFVKTKHPGMDVVIIRENEEDLYTGVEYRSTPGVAHAVKIISEAGSEKIIRYAFEYAEKKGRKKVSCFTKDNILKFSDGLFRKVFDRIASEYPDIRSEHRIIDIGAARLADSPELFDVIVLPNLYGDILSDVAGQIAGSIGLGGSANIGNFGAMFEAVHGSAPDIAGKNLANPSGLLSAAILMLEYLGLEEKARMIRNAWLTVLEEGIHTADIFEESVSKKKVGTEAFAEAIVRCFGSAPKKLAGSRVSSSFSPEKMEIVPNKIDKKNRRDLKGVDVYVYDPCHREEFLRKIPKEHSSFILSFVGNRGARIWPEGHEETFCIERWICRFLGKTDVNEGDVAGFLRFLHQAGISVIGTENLYEIDGISGYFNPEI